MATTRATTCCHDVEATDGEVEGLLTPDATWTPLGVVHGPEGSAGVSSKGSQHPCCGGTQPWGL
jgi:hypothetical protein